MKFTHLHTSSRFDRSTEVLEKALDNYMSQSDLITITEVGKQARSNKLKEKGWSHYAGNNGPRDESAVAWKDSEFELVYSESYKLSNMTHINNRGFRVNKYYASFVVLEAKNGATIVVGACHLPHGMAQELRRKKVRSELARTYVKNAYSFKNRGQSLKRKFKAEAVLLVSDWNIDVKRPWARAWFRTYAPMWKLNWKPPFGRRGTLGSRIIDASLFKGALRLVQRPIIMPHDDSSDHTPYKEQFRLG